MTDDDVVAWVTSRFPLAEITPAEFENFVSELFGCTGDYVEDLTVSRHETISGVDGTYDFDATVRFRLGGMDFLIVAEAKKHKNPIKREVVQILHDKMRSVGAQKAVLISTAPYQRGALDYAKTHRIALATVTEGRFTYETRTRVDSPAFTRSEARETFGLPDRSDMVMALILNARAITFVASRLGEDRWTTFAEKHMKNFWIYDVILEEVKTTIHDAMWCKVPASAAEAQAGFQQEFSQHIDGRNLFVFNYAIENFDELCSVIPENLPVGRSLRSIKRQTSTPKAIQNWCADIEQRWTRSLCLTERVRNSIAHGGPWTVGALVLAHEYSHWLAIRVLYQTVNGHLDGKSLKMTHEDMMTRADNWRARIVSTRSLRDLVLTS